MKNMNDDLISRRDAKSKKVYSHERHEYVVPVAELDWLPSAQPEQIARDIATIIENEQDMRVLLKNTERTEKHDLVSRRAAIKTAKNVAYYVDEHGSANGWLAMLVNWLEILPSAQPEHTETHSCECQRTETHAQWIPVSEASLPEDGVTVWVTINGYDVISCEDGETLEQAIARISKIRWVTQGYWSDEEHGWNDPSFGCPLMVQPIAWMPIDTPEPWRGEEHEL